MHRNILTVASALILGGALVGCGANPSVQAGQVTEGEQEREVLAATSPAADCPDTPADGFAVRTEQGTFVFVADDGTLRVLSASASGDGTFTISQPDPATLDLTLGADGEIDLGAFLDGDALRLDLDGSVGTQVIDLGTLGSVTLRVNGEVLELLDVNADAGVDYSIATEGELLRIRFDGEVDKELVAQVVDGSIKLGVGSDIEAALAAAGIDADAAVQAETGGDGEGGISVSGDVEGEVGTDVDADLSGDVSLTEEGIEGEVDADVTVTTP